MTGVDTRRRKVGARLILKLKWLRAETDTVYKRSFKKGEVVVPGHSGTLAPNYGVPNMAFIKSGTVEKAEE